MDLSIVIVNYNVRHYLEQCLVSVEAAMQGMDTEVFVVDNNSADDSVEMVRERFPWVKLIANKDNSGFASANNQALRVCTGRYVLLLNPDTIVERGTFSECINFMENKPECGAVCVKMVNGEGEFLKESKRGFPTPETSFYKISGLIRIFPHHQRIANYYMGHLSDDETAAIDIMPGAFIMLRHEVLDKVGLLDESYFMYGEDIDFSWRIRLAGYENYYLPKARILHYKGECTKRGSMNYVYTFYNAMSIFVRRYFSGGNAKLYNLLIQIAIWLRAGLAVLQRVVNAVALPVADFLISVGCFVLVKDLWAAYWADNINYYPASYTYFVLPLYAALLVFSTWLSGGYDKPIQLRRIVRGVCVGALLLLLFYSLLDETMRFSRAILLLGSALTLGVSLLLRWLFSLLGVDGYQYGSPRGRNYLIVGGKGDKERVELLFDQLGITLRSSKFVGAECLPNISSNDSILRRVDEIVFCTPSVDVATMLNVMERLSGKGIAFRTAPSYGSLLIGGSYVRTADDIYQAETDNIGTTHCRRSKRLFDIGSSLLLLIVSPALVWFERHKWRFYCNCWEVLIGRKTWVGYSVEMSSLPRLKKGVLRTRHLMPQVKRPDMERLDNDYAQHYTPLTDGLILIRNLTRL